MRINRPFGFNATDAAQRPARGSTTPPSSDRAGASVVSIHKGSAAPIADDMAARLAEVRRQLANGTYKVDYDRLADNILASELAPADVKKGES